MREPPAAPRTRMSGFSGEEEAWDGGRVSAMRGDMEERGRLWGRM